MSRSSSGPEPVLRPGETLDALFDGAIRLFQAERGSRFSIDALLLAAVSQVKQEESVVDLGCGNGVVALTMAYLWGPQRVLGIEVQEQLVERAIRNVALNGLQSSIDVRPIDVRRISEAVPSQSFDVAVMNPPYYPAQDGRINPDSERAVARHEIHGSLSDFLSAAAYALDHRGRLVCIYPAFRLPMFLASLTENGFKPAWVRPVRPRMGEEATLFLIEARKGGAPRFSIKPAVVVHDGDGYTEEVEAVLEGKIGDRPFP